MKQRAHLLLCYFIFAAAAFAQNVPNSTGPEASAPAVHEITVQERLGYPVSARLLVIHADDLGMNHSVT